MNNHDPPGENEEGGRLPRPTPLECDRTTRHETSNSRRAEHNGRLQRLKARLAHIARSAGTTVERITKTGLRLVVIWRFGKLIIEWLT